MWRRIAVIGLAVADVVTGSIRSDHHAQTVDEWRLAIGEQQLRLRGSDPRVAAQLVDQRFEPTRIDRHVIVQQGHRLGSLGHRPSNTEVHASGIPTVTGAPDHLDPVEQFMRHRRGPVTVVHHHDPSCSTRIATQRSQALLEHPIGRIEGEDDDSDHDEERTTSGALRTAGIALSTVSGTLYITGDRRADELLNSNGTALLVGMLLDQQVTMEWAFSGPSTLHTRLGHLDAAKIAAMLEDDLVAVCCERPAIHRYPAVMARRIHALSRALTDRFDGRGELVWTGVSTGAELYERLRTLPGFGDEKTKIFIALLGKRFSVRPDGWEQAAGVFSDGTPRSVADIHDTASLAAVREWKKAAKAAKRDKQDRPIR